MDDLTNPVLGIDFGTSYLRIARWDGLRAIPMQFRTGHCHMASAVYVDSDTKDILAGEHALLRGALSPGRVVRDIKRHLGEEGQTVSLEGESLPPVEVVTSLLKASIADVQNEFPIGVWQSPEAVITHPYCFRYPQIAVLREAASRAGINVLRLVPDPVVLPLLDEFRAGAEANDGPVMIVDLGGGMLDVALLDVGFEHHKVTVDVLATAGNDQLGGIDFDEVIIDLALDRARDRDGLDLGALDETSRLRALWRLRKEADRAKRELSATDMCHLAIPDVVPGRRINIALSRDEIEDACQPHLERIRQALHDAIGQAGLSMQGIGRVITTGGATRMPAVVRLIADTTGTEPHPIDPEHAVARGAAVLAAAEGSRLEQKEFVLNLRTPYAIGLRTAEGDPSTLFSENSLIPFEVTRHLETIAQGATPQVDVFQGSNDENSTIGVIAIPEPQDGHEPVQIAIAVDAQQLIRFRVGTDTTPALLQVPGVSRADAQGVERATFCPEAKDLVEELERAVENLPTPVARVVAHVTDQARAGEPPDGNAATSLVYECSRFAVDCLFADYAMRGRKDVGILQVLAQEPKDDPGTLQVALAERLIILAKQGHIATESPLLVKAAEALLNEVGSVVDESISPDAPRDAPPVHLDAARCRHLMELMTIVFQALDGFIIFAGYGDSVYRFQGTTPTKDLAPDAPKVRHGECVLVNFDTAQMLLLSRLWDIREGPSLHRKALNALSSLREWTVEGTRVVMVASLLQELIVDAIMLTSDSQLSMSTVTGASVAQVAGAEFRQGVRGKHVEFGNVISTPAGTLAAKEVYHACTIDGTRQPQSDDLRSLLSKVLCMAATAGHSSVALPLVGANYGIKTTDIADNYVQAFQEHAWSNSLPSLIVLSVRNLNGLVAREVISALDTYQEKAAFASRKADVFISARHPDYEYATQIYRFLKSQGLAVFFSQESLPQLGSSDYRREIDRALDEAQYMIVVTSSIENVQSSWVEAEWGFFINEKRSGRKSGNLVTLAVGSVQPSDLPPSLRYYEVLPFQPETFEKLLHYVGD